MIKLKDPSIFLHSCDVPGYKYRGWQTWTMPKGASAGNVLYWINWAIDHSPEMYVHNVVINCHGTPGFLHVGGAWKGFGDGDTSIFKPLRSRGSIGRIILVACHIAGHSDEGPEKDKDDELGKQFCSDLARESGAFVVGADAFQRVDFWFENISHPYSSIDDFEGPAFAFSPPGGWKGWPKDY